ncbi:Protein kinase domain-containing protein [Mycena sanguinolenta]|uniref:Protein kinase domain-containing protein n=1 Tax=Mycena sanguinolenta TaxID=230812 RepID=A0A8H6Y291_9AGAR|nr:Protein kinase domain-containing protein [Mycena sanguinolenta]
MDHTHDPVNDALPAIKITAPSTERLDSPTANNLHNYQESGSAAVAVESAYPSAFGITEPPASQERLDKLEDKLGVPITKGRDVFDELNAYYTKHSSAINSAGSVLAADLDLKSIERAFTKFAETSKVLVDGLELLGKLHPFVGVAVLPFKLMITLDLTRRQNNRKVLAVKSQMQDTMSVLFRLRRMHDFEMKAPDGTPLKGISDLMCTIAEDIKDCGTACDLYSNKNGLAKMIKSKVYETRFADFMTTFENHKKNLMVELETHTATGVDATHEKLDKQGEDLTFIKEKVEVLFRKLDMPREQNVQKFIADKGGVKACLESDITLKELVQKSGESLASFDPTHAGQGDIATVRRMLTEELAEDVEKAFTKHMALFRRKLDVQERQLKDAINQTGEHVISAVIGFLSGGVHTRVKHPDLKSLWEQQGWKGSVDARGFVLAINDYYANKFHSTLSPAPSVAWSATNSVPGSPPGSPIMSPVLAERMYPEPVKPEDDSWALAYINVAHLQSLLDVIDTDGTGLISINEVNSFVRLRPHDCSLIKWLAFWAAGWHVTVTWYKNRIYKILSAMLSLVQRVKPPNRNAADRYFAGLGIQRVELLLRSTRSSERMNQTIYRDDARLGNMVEEFRTAEAEKLENQLNGLGYELDDINTLRLTTGLRQIERIELYVYPLLYQLLLRHFDIMRLARVHILYESEFETMSTSLATIFEVVNQRTDKLAGIFKSNARDVQESFGSFAFGMFQLLHGDHQPDPINNTIATFQEEDGFEYSDEDLDPDSDDDEETQEAIFTRLQSPNTPSVLLYGLGDEPKHANDLEERHPILATLADPLDDIWTGQLLFPDGTAPEGTLSMLLTHTPDGLTGTAENYLGVLDVSGTVKDQSSIRFMIAWPDGFAVVCTGKHDQETDTITGSWESKSDRTDALNAITENMDQAPEDTNSTDYRFVFQRPPSFRYARFSGNPSRARWEFAIGAALDAVRRRRTNWWRITDRLAQGKQFVELRKRQEIDSREISIPQWKPLSAEESAKLQRLKTELHPSDARFYNEVADFELQQLVDHDRFCDSCNRAIWDTRLLCIQCMDDHYYEGVDLCFNCHEHTPQFHGFTHLRPHPLVKTFRRIHDGELAWLIPEAKAVAKRVKKHSKDAQATPSRAAGAPQSKSHPTTSKSQIPQPRCCYCNEHVFHPFWVCVYCVPDTYICASCDAKGAVPKHDGANPTHELSHPLVELFDNEPIPEPVATEVTLVELLKRVSGLETKLDTKIKALETKLETVETKLECRLALLEAILNGQHS